MQHPPPPVEMPQDNASGMPSETTAETAERMNESLNRYVERIETDWDTEQTQGTARSQPETKSSS